MITKVVFVVSGQITKVKRLRKKRVALGFKTLVRNPSRSADEEDLSVDSFSLSLFDESDVSNELVVLVSELRHIYKRYTAQAILIAVKSWIDWLIRTASHKLQYKICIPIPAQNHIAVEIPILLPYWSEFLRDTIRSGHGLITAKRWIPRTVSIREISITEKR